MVIARAFDVLRQEACAKPEWWSDEGLKALSARVLRAAPNEESPIDMRAYVLSGFSDAWEMGPRSAAELKEAAAHFDRSVALCDAPVWKVELSSLADGCRSLAEAGRGHGQSPLQPAQFGAPPLHAGALPTMQAWRM